MFRRRLQRFYTMALIWSVPAAIVTMLTWKVIASPWPAMVTIKHVAAMPNCTAARAVGLAPANYGEPGYWPQHDRDNDGIACEPWPRWRRGAR